MQNAKNTQNGMSLVELLVVLAILSLSAASAVGLIRNTSPSLALKSVQGSLINDLKAERQKALANGIISSISFNQEGYEIKRTNSQKKWPRGITLEAEIGNSTTLIFFEDGSSNGLSFKLNKNTHSTLIFVNPLSGAVSNANL